MRLKYDQIWDVTIRGNKKGRGTWIYGSRHYFMKYGVWILAFNLFNPVITTSTSVGSSSATLIYHMCINYITSSYHSGIIINDVANHFGTFCILTILKVNKIILI